MLKRPSKNISVYLNYPTEERLNILRERVKSWNALDKLKEQRLSKIATQKEIVSYLMGDAETIAAVDSRQKEIDRRKNKSTEPISMDIETPIMKKWRKELEKIERKKQAELDRKLVDMVIGEPKSREFYMPEFVSNVLDGGAYPEQYECDAREQKILYNQKFIELFQQYRTAKSQTTADIVLSQIVSLVKELDQ